ncbi:hypothetical protein [Symbiobacterium thermophilum]|uniref:hypothetical protein n=1 Tax=Symbiobacterium thermophilum TaxID=2734 RepID=UPI0011D1408E|nr:hypothetical protein [Symbiobacterium thermophilum]
MRARLVSGMLALLLLIGGCGQVDAAGLVEEYLTALTIGDFDRAAQLSTEALVELNGDDSAEARFVQTYLAQVRFTVREAQKEDDDRYRVPVELIAPDLRPIVGRVLANLLGEAFASAFMLTPLDEKTMTQRLVDSLTAEITRSDASTITVERTVMVERIDGQWKVTTPVFAESGLLDIFDDGFLANSYAEESRARRAESLRRRIAAIEEQLTELRRDREFAEQSRSKLSKFVVSNAKFYWAVDGWWEEPVIELTVQNNTEFPVARAYFHGRLVSPGRSVPWVEEDFNYAIPGGIEPGEIQTWKLVANSFSTWGSAPRDRDDLILEVEVTRLDGPNDQVLLDAEFPDYKAEWLADLEADLAELQEELRALRTEE